MGETTEEKFDKSAIQTIIRTKNVTFVDLVLDKVELGPQPLPRLRFLPHNILEKSTLAAFELLCTTPSSERWTIHRDKYGGSLIEAPVDCLGMRYASSGLDKFSKLRSSNIRSVEHTSARMSAHSVAYSREKVRSNCRNADPPTNQPTSGIISATALMSDRKARPIWTYIPLTFRLLMHVILSFVFQMATGFSARRLPLSFTEDMSLGATETDPFQDLA